MSALVPGQGGGEGKKVCRRELGRSPCRSFPDPSRCEDSSSSREGFLRLSYGSVSVCLLCLLCTTSPPAARVQGPILARFDSFRAKGRVSIGLCSDHADCSGDCVALSQGYPWFSPRRAAPVGCCLLPPLWLSILSIFIDSRWCTIFLSKCLVYRLGGGRIQTQNQRSGVDFLNASI